MMRYWLYTLLMWLLWPLWVVYSYQRCKKFSNKGQCWHQLWAISPPQQQHGIWIHAVSLGETQAAFILIRALRDAYPALPIYLTGGNKSALDYAQKQTITGVEVSLLSIDYGWCRQRLFNRLKPRLLLLMETEFWPTLLKTAHQQKVPVAIIQARLSKSSKELYPKYGQPLLRQLLTPISFVAAQTSADADALIHLGIRPDHCTLLGNIKYDFTPDTHLKDNANTLQDRIGARWIWVAGSTHPNEEWPLLEAHQQLIQQIPNALLILVPRHPHYFDQLASHLSKSNITFRRWQDWYQTDQSLDTDCQVLLVDTLGQLMLAYQIANACFVGGSLVPWGGHNLLEPAALAKPIIAGIHNHNFAEIEAGLLAAEAMSLVQDSDSLYQALLNVYQAPTQAQQQGERAQTYFYQQQGATKRLLSALAPYLQS